MRLSKKTDAAVHEMTDPVEGSAKILRCDIDVMPDVHLLGITLHRTANSSVPKWLPGTMRLDVCADGVPLTTVEWQGRCRRGHQVFRGQTIPVVVDRADPTRISIKWSEMPTTEETLRMQKERADQEVLQSLRESVENRQKLGQDPRVAWRDLREQGLVTSQQFDEEMRRFDGAPLGEGA